MNKKPCQTKKRKPVVKPCEQPCSKCGSQDINLQFLPKGMATLPANGSYLDSKRPLPSDTIRAHCRCCTYEWDMKPLNP